MQRPGAGVDARTTAGQRPAVQKEAGGTKRGWRYKKRLAVQKRLAVLEG